MSLDGPEVPPPRTLSRKVKGLVPRMPMHVQINAPHVEIPNIFEEYIETSIAENLTAFATRVTRIEVHLQDLNGQKGGVDKRCLIEARMSGMDPIASESSHEDSKTAFHEALTKLKRALEHRIDRLSSNSKRNR